MAFQFISSEEYGIYKEMKACIAISVSIAYYEVWTDDNYDLITHLDHCLSSIFLSN